jgi:hypothetical protein
MCTNKYKDSHLAIDINSSTTKKSYRDLKERKDRFDWEDYYAMENGIMKVNSGR